MNSEPLGANSVSSAWKDGFGRYPSRSKAYVVYLIGLTLLFVQPLVELLRYSNQNSLHSHIPLVPVVAGYLLYLESPQEKTPRTSIVGTLAMVAIGLTGLLLALVYGATLSLNDRLAAMSVAYVCFVASGGFLFRGFEWMKAMLFPLSFMVFFIPLPDAVVNWLEHASVLGSADVAAALFTATGTPMLRAGTILGLPGITLEVAQECSGIRSSWVLFITSIVASHMFLRTTWRRAVLVFFVIPLAIVRNGFRILVIGLLCVHVGPHMIDSVIHHRGGPIFFALSLVPLFGLMIALRRQEQSK